MSDLDKSDINDNKLKIAYQFWQLIRDQHDRLNLKLEKIENAICEDWVKPIHYLIDKKKKSIEEFEQVYLFLEKDQWWEGRVVDTKKLTKKNPDGLLYFDYFLKEKRKQANETKLLNKEEISIALERSFPNPTEHLVKLFTDYQTMIYEKDPKLFKTSNLSFEINKLAKGSNYTQINAVNILRKSLERNKDLVTTQIKNNTK